MAKERTLIIEAPDTRATVDFLSHGAVVELAIVDGALQIRVRVAHGENASSWDQYDFEAPLNTGS